MKPMIWSFLHKFIAEVDLVQNGVLVVWPKFLPYGTNQHRCCPYCLLYVSCLYDASCLNDALTISKSLLYQCLYISVLIISVDDCGFFVLISLLGFMKRPFCSSLLFSALLFSILLFSSPSSLLYSSLLFSTLLSSVGSCEGCSTLIWKRACR